MITIENLSHTYDSDTYYRWSRMSSGSPIPLSIQNFTNVSNPNNYKIWIATGSQYGFSPGRGIEYKNYFNREVSLDEDGVLTGQITPILGFNFNPGQPYAVGLRQYVYLDFGHYEQNDLDPELDWVMDWKTSILNNGGISDSLVFANIGNANTQNSTHVRMRYVNTPNLAVLYAQQPTMSSIDMPVFICDKVILETV